MQQIKNWRISQVSVAHVQRSQNMDSILTSLEETLTFSFGYYFPRLLSFFGPTIGSFIIGLGLKLGKNGPQWTKNEYFCLFRN